jgi:hypothetical protein
MKKSQCFFFLPSGEFPISVANFTATTAEAVRNVQREGQTKTWSKKLQQRKKMKGHNLFLNYLEEIPISWFHECWTKNEG